MFDVLAHILCIFGSVHHLHASSIYVLRLPAPHPFSYCISFLRISPFSSYVHPYVLSVWRAISSLLLPFLLQDHRFPTVIFPPPGPSGNRWSWIWFTRSKVPLLQTRWRSPAPKPQHALQPFNGSACAQRSGPRVRQPRGCQRALILRDQNYASSATHFVYIYTPCLYTRYT
jgi:hypothetical protein